MKAQAWTTAQSWRGSVGGGGARSAEEMDVGGVFTTLGMTQPCSKVCYQQLHCVFSQKGGSPVGMRRMHT